MHSTKAVLIVGGSGFVGTHLALRLRERFKVFATYNQHPVRMPGVTYLPANVNNRTWIKRIVYTVRPEVIVYAAGNNSAEAAETNAREFEHVHAGGAGNVANVAEILAPKFIYLSNCYTFDGNRGNYHENDTVLPITALGKAKLGGENFIRGKCLNYAILRSSPLFGRSGGTNLSFLDRLRIQLDRGERVELPDEEAHSFSPVQHFVEAVERLIDSSIKNRVFHYGGLTKMTHVEFGRRFAEHFGYDPNLVQPRRSAVRERLGRPHAGPIFDYSMNSTQTIELLKIQSLLLEEGFDLIEKKLVTGL